MDSLPVDNLPLDKIHMGVTAVLALLVIYLMWIRTYHVTETIRTTTYVDLTEDDQEKILGIERSITELTTISNEAKNKSDTVMAIISNMDFDSGTSSSTPPATNNNSGTGSSAIQNQLMIKQTEMESKLNKLNSDVAENKTKIASLETGLGVTTGNITSLTNAVQTITSSVEALNQSVAEVKDNNKSNGKSTELDGVPVGTIIHSSLAFAQFKLALGINSSEKWLPADGRTVPSTSDYARVANTTSLPDLRGLFMRTDNGGRNDAFKNPSSSEDQALLVPIKFKSGLPLVAGSGKSKTYELDMKTTTLAHAGGIAASAGAHTHTINSAGSTSKSTNSSGGHSHSGTTASSGSHRHGYTIYSDEGSGGSSSTRRIWTGREKGSSFSSSSGNDYPLIINEAGAHTHTFSTGTAGSHSHTIDLSHTHTMTSAGAHTHTVSMNNHVFTPSGSVTLTYDSETAPNHMNVFTYIKVYN